MSNVHKEIVLGDGAFQLHHIEHMGKKGILFSENSEKQKIGSLGPWEDGEYEPKETDVILFVKNKESLVVLRDYVDGLSLKMNGWDVTTSKDKKTLEEMG